MTVCQARAWSKEPRESEQIETCPQVKGVRLRLLIHGFRPEDLGGLNHIAVADKEPHPSLAVNPLPKQRQYVRLPPRDA